MSVVTLRRSAHNFEGHAHSSFKITYTMASISELFHNRANAKHLEKISVNCPVTEKFWTNDVDHPYG